MTCALPRLLPLYAPACALALAFAPIPALARSISTMGPPSGIVIHLFGNGPTVTNSNDAGGAQGGSNAGDGSTGGSIGGGTSDAGSSAPPLTWSDIGHEMFVTGNPAQENSNALPKGKASK